MSFSRLAVFFGLAATFIGMPGQSLAVNQPPTARDDQYLRRDGSGPFELFVLWNDFDSEQNQFHIVSVTQGQHGSVAITADGQTVSYQLTENGFTGYDIFTYTIADS